MNRAEQELYYWYQNPQDRSWFTAKLFDLIAKADVFNLEKIRQGFPEEVQAWERYQRDGEFWAEESKTQNY